MDEEVAAFREGIVQIATIPGSKRHLLEEK
jgi:hypothetical protein